MEWNLKPNTQTDYVDDRLPGPILVQDVGFVLDQQHCHVDKALVHGIEKTWSQGLGIIALLREAHGTTTTTEQG